MALRGKPHAAPIFLVYLNHHSDDTDQRHCTVNERIFFQHIMYNLLKNYLLWKEIDGQKQR